MRKIAALLSIAILFSAGCAADDSSGSTETEVEDSSDSTQDVTLTLLTHDSFLVTEGIFDTFTDETGISVEVVRGSDAGELVSAAVLTAGNPQGDVLFGIDNTFLQRGLDNDVFTPHISDLLASVPDEFELDPEHRVTPIDYGDVCVNATLAGVDGQVPTSIDDLTDPIFAGSFVTQNPETSSPGFAFLLATIATYGEDGWEAYWSALAEGGVTVSAGWNDAYYGDFVSGGGDKQIVTSYATSPVAEVLFAEPAIDTAPTTVIVDSCFRQIEFAGVLAGTDHPKEAGLLIDFMLSETFQADIPLNMFVAPANADVALPAAFVEHGVVVSEPLILDPAEIEANRAEWTARWTEIVLR